MTPQEASRLLYGNIRFGTEPADVVVLQQIQSSLLNFALRGPRLIPGTKNTFREHVYAFEACAHPLRIVWRSCTPEYKNYDHHHHHHPFPLSIHATILDADMTSRYSARDATAATTRLLAWIEEHVEGFFVKESFWENPAQGAINDGKYGEFSSYVSPWLERSRL